MSAEIMILDKKISNPIKAWDNSLEEKIEEFSYKLDERCIEELSKNKEKLSNQNPDDFNLLNQFVDNLKKNVLIDGCGFFVINGKELSHFDISEKKNINIIISKMIGKLLEQNKNHDVHVDIKDLGKSMKTGGRYHHTKEGGSYHTDGSHLYKNPPDYVGLLCINPAKKGGVSKFMSAYTIHNKLLDQKEILKVLYNRFHHDRKNEHSENENPTRFEPIFEFLNDNLKFTFDIFSSFENSPAYSEPNETIIAPVKVAKSTMNFGLNFFSVKVKASAKTNLPSAFVFNTSIVLPL